ncbi:Translocated intimin receptor Tir [Edwardsiella anguillarum]|uniref:Tir intimin-binding domain-containing protein n=1 Tax=Edwardsiella TaxID=635 RepID=UPI0005B57B9A|nr:Tir intimin-binding domain-containing protein [Edwardsiella anguillarum]AJK93272.1 putative translocated intimin receptor protein Tir [Edwardsiella sp. EA181011]BET82095.1 Translocated intimin receptor Tir [Edwardsiella anguillarum]BET85524.1 Translocated intimin receptor Tir [Edwardsiella anguillarum]BET88887.1 Translocated intimin receptor Tir [Edwardsiella anguillarum]BET92178.1 Translocated intimin receptor Tir [Edwardsiella anguillarum]
MKLESAANSPLINPYAPSESGTQNTANLGRLGDRAIAVNADSSARDGGQLPGLPSSPVALQPSRGSDPVYRHTNVYTAQDSFEAIKGMSLNMLFERVGNATFSRRTTPEGNVEAVSTRGQHEMAVLLPQDEQYALNSLSPDPEANFVFIGGSRSHPLVSLAGESSEVISVRQTLERGQGLSDRPGGVSPLDSSLFRGQLEHSLGNRTGVDREMTGGTGFLHSSHSELGATGQTDMRGSATTQALAGQADTINQGPQIDGGERLRELTHPQLVEINNYIAVNPPAMSRSHLYVALGTAAAVGLTALATGLSQAFAITPAPDDALVVDPNQAQQDAVTNTRNELTSEALKDPANQKVEVDEMGNQRPTGILLDNVAAEIEVKAQEAGEAAKQQAITDNAVAQERHDTQQEKRDKELAISGGAGYGAAALIGAGGFTAAGVLYRRNKETHEEAMELHRALPQAEPPVGNRTETGTRSERFTFPRAVVLDQPPREPGAVGGIYQGLQRGEWSAASSTWDSASQTSLAGNVTLV